MPISRPSLFNRFGQPSDGIAGLLSSRPWSTSHPYAIDEEGALSQPIDAMSGVDTAMAENAATPRKPSFFGKGGVGRNIAGLLGDYLAQLGGGQPVYAPLMERQRALDMYEKRRRDDWEDWQKRRFWPRGGSNVGDEDFEG